jgi:hypothetical protein
VIDPSEHLNTCRGDNPPVCIAFAITAAARQAKRALVRQDRDDFTLLDKALTELTK